MRYRCFFIEVSVISMACMYVIVTFKFITFSYFVSSDLSNIMFQPRHPLQTNSVSTLVMWSSKLLLPEECLMKNAQCQYSNLSELPYDICLCCLFVCSFHIVSQILRSYKLVVRSFYELFELSTSFFPLSWRLYNECNWISSCCECWKFGN